MKTIASTYIYLTVIHIAIKSAGSFLSPNQFSFASTISTHVLHAFGEKSSNDELEIKEESLRYFKEYANRGLTKFRQRDIDGAVTDLKTAAGFNTSQPLPQLGIMLYCIEEYDMAAERLRKDIEILEGSRYFKATELRLWHSACQNRLGNKAAAVSALDHTNLSPFGLFEDRYIFNRTLLFYAGENTLEDMLDIIGRADQSDFGGTIFFGNFFLGLFFDSIGNKGYAQAFLNRPSESTRYPPNDMWFHLPRVLYDMRFPKSPDHSEVNTAGMIV